MLVKRKDDKLSICAITVDDCLFALSRQAGWRDEQVAMLREAFDSITVETGDIQEIIGMHVKIDRMQGRALVSQRHYADKIEEIWYHQRCSDPFYK